MVKIAEMGQKGERIGLKIDKNGLNWLKMDQKSKTKFWGKNRKKRLSKIKQNTSHFFL